MHRVESAGNRNDYFITGMFHSDMHSVLRASWWSTIKEKPLQPKLERLMALPRLAYLMMRSIPPENVSPVITLATNPVAVERATNPATAEPFGLSCALSQSTTHCWCTSRETASPNSQVRLSTVGRKAKPTHARLKLDILTPIKTLPV